MQLRKDLLELRVLDIPGERRVYGCDFVKTLNALGGPAVSEGAVSPLLSRPRREHLVSTTADGPSDGPARTHWQMTAAGRPAQMETTRTIRFSLGDSR